MNKWFKGLTIAAFVLAVLAVMLVFLRGPDFKGAGTRKMRHGSRCGQHVPPVVQGSGILLKDENKWMVVIKKHYDDLTALLQKQNWDGIAALYGSDAILNSAERARQFKGGTDIAFNFWKSWQEKKRRVKIVGFDIDEIKIFYVDFPVQFNGYSDRFNQLVHIRGKFNTEASPASAWPFEAMGGHIQSCPDFILSENF